MKARYVHTNLVASNWQDLAAFYVDVFGCVPVPPERHLSGDWLDRAIALTNARIDGIHLRLPGHGDRGPTLEVFQYSEEEPVDAPASNRRGYGHLAFEMEDVRSMVDIIALHGGGLLGEIVTKEIRGVGMLTFAYAVDPEGNIIEVQSWEHSET